MTLWLSLQQVPATDQNWEGHGRKIVVRMQVLCGFCSLLSCFSFLCPTALPVSLP